MNENISDELKIYELSLIWKEAEYNFAFWEKLSGVINWDEEYKKALPRVLATDNLYDYYMELSKFLAILRDGHTGVYGFPQSVKENLTCLPIDVRYLAGSHVIVNMDKSLENDIKPFSVIKRFDGVDVFEYIEKNIFPYYWHEKYDTACDMLDYVLTRGTAEDEVELEIEYDGVSKTISLKRWNNSIKRDWLYDNFAVKKPFEELEDLYSSESHMIKKTKDNIGVITIDTFINDNLGEEFYANQKILENMRGFIIDVRANYGGSSHNADAVSAAYIGGEFQNGRDLKPIYIGTYKAWAQWRDFGDKPYEEVMHDVEQLGGDAAYTEKCYKIPKHIYYEENIWTAKYDNCPFLLKQPLVVLSSYNTGSAAEDFLVTLDQSKRAVLVGSASGGSTGQPLTIKLESGGSVRICTMNCTYPDGRQFIDIGVQPHIKCELTLDDYKNGIDSVMNKGLEEIRKLI